MSVRALDTIKKNFKEYTIESDGIVAAKYFVVESRVRGEAYIERNLLNVVLEGEKRLHTKNGDVTVRAGEAFFLAKGEYVMSEIAENGRYACLLIFFDEHSASNILASMPDFEIQKIDAKEGFLKVELTPLMKATAESILPFIEDKPKYADELLGLKLKELLLLLFGSKDGAKFAYYFRSAMCGKLELKAFMDENFTEEWSLSEFAKKSGRSLSAFKSDFKKIFGLTPMEWLWAKRLERAKFLIEGGGLGAGEAAFRSGFKSQSHFNRMFKDRYARTPKSKQG